MINYLKSTLYTIIVILASTSIITILNYFNILNKLPLEIIMLLIPIIGVFIGSYKIGKTSNKKGYIEGFKYGILCLLILLIINIITKNITLLSTIYYILILLFSTVAGSLGINRKKN